MDRSQQVPVGALWQHTFGLHRQLCSLAVRFLGLGLLPRIRTSLNLEARLLAHLSSGF